MTGAPSARSRGGIAVITAVAAAAVLALGGWLGLVVLSPRLGSSFDEQVPGDRADHIVVERLRGLLGERWELQMQVGYDGEPPRWRVPMPHGVGPDVLLASELVVVRLSEGAPDTARLEAYAYDDGERLWSVPDEDGGLVRPWLAEAEGLLLEACSGPTRLRAIELATGRVRWELGEALLAGHPVGGWSVRPQPASLEIVLADAVLAIDAEDGDVTHLEPSGSSSVARCHDLVASQGSDGRLWLSTPGIAPLEIGRAPRGRVSCTSNGRGGALVAWNGVDGAGDPSPERGEPLDDGVVPPAVEGAVLAVRGLGGPDAARSWAFATRGDGPRTVSLGPPCRATFYDPWASNDDTGEPPPPPPRLSFDCETGAPAIDDRPW